MAMGLFSKISGDPGAVAAHKSARAALAANADAEKQRGVRDETARFGRLNKAVADAERDVPWWRR